MALQLYVSNSLENLSEKLSTDLSVQSKGVFHRPYIITQTEGINSWLRIRIAEDLGIASNISFLGPTDIISLVYKIVCGKKMPPLSVSQLQWIIYDILGKEHFIKKFPAISGYYENHEAKRLSLAMKVADLFDQYQIYRPDSIVGWNKGIPETDTDLQWQFYLWQQVLEQTDRRFSDKTTVTHQILEALTHPENQDKLRVQIPDVYFFGLAIITPFYLQLFHRLSEIISVSFYLNNPAPESYWMDNVTETGMIRLLQKNKRLGSQSFTLGNELLINWGKVIKDSFWLLFKDENFLNVYDDSYIKEPEEPNTLLQKIQKDIYNNATGSERIKLYLEDVKDGSIVIHSAYTPSREVEVLYNYLIDLIERQRADLAPRDILVMVNDIDKYAPFIHAVFENAPYKFPFNIADESLSTGNNLFSALHALLNIDEDNFSGEKVTELLDNQYIRKRFDITDLDLVRKAVLSANIRFGWEGNYEHDTRYVSWNYGLQRLLLGICIGNDDPYNFNNELLNPVDNFEGDQAYEVVRFIHFVRTLRKFIVKREGIKMMKEWIEDLKELVDEMIFESGEKEDDDFHLFIDYTERMAGDKMLAEIQVSFDAFKKGFVEKLSTEKRKHSFIKGGVTFCSFIPMRSIPFKVVAMLGLDFDKFPRKESQISFSLFKKNQSRGDRNVKENDKHLFLETLLSAREYLYLSYKGNSTKDGAALPSSSLLEELVDYVIKGVIDKPAEVRKNWIVHHPLHGFSQRYFNHSGLSNYLSDEQFESNIKELNGVGEEQTFNFDELDINHLISFLQDPVKWYFNKTLKIYYFEKDLLLPEQELFELNKWDAVSIINSLLEMDESSTDIYVDNCKRVGRLPLKNMGTLITGLLREAIKPLKEKINEVCGNAQASTIPVSLKLDKTILSGVIQNIYDNKMIVAMPPESKQAVIWMKAYISFLAARAMNKNLSLHFIYPDKKNYDVLQLQSADITPSEAITILNQCIEFFIQGHEQPFCFYPKADNYKKIFLSGEEAYLTEVEKWRDSERGPLQNPYLNKADKNGYFSEANYPLFKSNNEILLAHLTI
jgi:exodeoxyribonuclease V gamma subunit